MCIFCDFLIEFLNISCYFFGYFCDRFLVPFLVNFGVENGPEIGEKRVINWKGVQEGLRDPSWGRFWGPLGVPWGLLGLLGAPLGTTWGPFGTHWRSLGCLFGAFWALQSLPRRSPRRFSTKIVKICESRNRNVKKLGNNGKRREALQGPRAVFR